MTVSGRKVIVARFHQSVHVPGIGELGNVLPSQGKRLELEMVVTDGGLLVKILGPTIKADLLVPSANVIGMQLALEVAPVAKAPVAKK